MSWLDHRLEPEVEVRRFEVINGALGRRCWSTDERAQILQETLAPGVAVSLVARRHGLSPQQFLAWRREPRKAAAALPAFVPAVTAPGLAAAEPAPAKAPRQRARRPPSRRWAAAIGLDVAGVKVTIENGSSPATIAAVTGALKGSK